MLQVLQVLQGQSCVRECDLRPLQEAFIVAIHVNHGRASLQVAVEETEEPNSVYQELCVKQALKSRVWDLWVNIEVAQLLILCYSPKQ